MSVLEAIRFINEEAARAASSDGASFEYTIPTSSESDAFQRAAVEDCQQAVIVLN
jgi:hypothetical protein